MSVVFWDNVNVNRQMRDGCKIAHRHAAYIHIGCYRDSVEIFNFMWQCSLDGIRQTGYTCDNDGANALRGVAKSTAFVGRLM
jgi:hypothetical protein